MLDYVATYKMNNGCLVKVYKTSNGLVDNNGIVITEEELKEYIKID